MALKDQGEPLVMDVDVKRLIEQEPEFEAYLKTVALGVILKASPELARVVYSMYQEDIRPDQVVKFLTVGGVK